MDSKTILVHICNKDRPTELSLLLQSLRTQTYQNFNILILDDGSTTPLTNYYFIVYMINRLKAEGHDVIYIRNPGPSGVSKARQQLVNFSMLNRKEQLYARLDDDVVIQPDYFEKLITVIDAGYDLASGITSPFNGVPNKRDIKFVKPIINECILNDKGELIKNGDDCGYDYTEEVILPAHHFRSCALYKKAIHDAGVDYNSRLSRNGFREEQIFSFKMLLKGFKIGVHTGANALHLMTPSGGERDTMNMTEFNQGIFEETTKRMFEDNGDFLNNKHQPSKAELLKATNLVYKKEDINLLNES